ncbi:Stomatal closure-related actin-binding protein 3 [Spatholobus suberectus]|nr:Stomatal closure-related actin-binding protein 3 [Spatholobus suberectus]
MGRNCSPRPYTSYVSKTCQGATKSVYAPEPFDIGRILQVDIISEGQQITSSTTGPIDPGWVPTVTWDSVHFRGATVMLLTYGDKEVMLILEMN